MLPIFITGNQDKANYMSRMLGIELEHQSIDLDEIQSPDQRVVVEHKARQAYDLIKKPVVVDDSSLCFNALHGLPGTFVKFFREAPDGLEMMCRMLDGFEDRTAYATAIFGYYDGEKFEYFEGRMDGVITNHPRGEGGYGWDQIFEPDGYGGRTRAELTPEEDAETYVIIRDFAGLKAFLTALK